MSAQKISPPSAALGAFSSISSNFVHFTFTPKVKKKFAAAFGGENFAFSSIAKYQARACF
jgi:hypothetical protein